MSENQIKFEKNHIPNNWKIETWEDVCEICYGKEQKDVEDPDGAYKIFGSGGVMGKSKKYLYNKPSVLIGRKGTIDKPLYVEEPFWTVDTLFYTKIRNGINSKWFYYNVLNTPLKKFNEATGVPSLSRSNIYKIKIFKPPLPEQQKIAEILSTVDEKIEVIEAQINQTTALKKGLMQQLLTKGIGHIKFKDSPLGKIPESWEAVKLGELSEKVGSGITPKGGHEAYVERGVVFIRSQNVLRGKLDLSDVVFISEDQHIKMSNSWLRPNDVLLNITGASIGRSCIVPDDMSKGNVNQHVCIIRPNEKIIASYLSQLLNSKYGIDQIDKFQAGGNREGLNYQQIRSFVIPLPPKNEQLKIAGIVGTIDKKLESLELKRNYFNEFKKGLMQQLLTGKLRVNLNPSNHAAKSGDLQPTE